MIADLEATAEMLHGFLRKAGSSGGPLRRNALVCVPSGATWVERRSVAAALEARRWYSVQLIDEPVAAAAGAGLDLAAGAGGFIVDIGGGTTEVAAVAGWRVVRAESLRMAGNAMDEAIVNAARSGLGLILSQRAARQLKVELGLTGGPDGWAEAVGLDAARRTPRITQRSGSSATTALISATDSIRSARPGSSAPPPVSRTLPRITSSASPAGISDRTCCTVRPMVFTTGSSAPATRSPGTFSSRGVRRAASRPTASAQPS